MIHPTPWRKNKQLSQNGAILILDSLPRKHDFFKVLGELRFLAIIGFPIFILTAKNHLFNIHKIFAQLL